MPLDCVNRNCISAPLWIAFDSWGKLASALPTNCVTCKTLTQEKPDQLTGPILALDVGQKRVGAAVSDSMLISITQLPALNRHSWKQLLQDVVNLSRRFDAKTLVIGLPLSLDGTKGSAALEVEHTARKFSKSLGIPVYLQDERLSTIEAEERLREAGYPAEELKKLVDSQSAAIILADFIGGGQHRVLV